MHTPTLPFPFGSWRETSTFDRWDWDVGHGDKLAIFASWYWNNDAAWASRWRRYMTGHRHPWPSRCCRCEQPSSTDCLDSIPSSACYSPRPSKSNSLQHQWRPFSRGCISSCWLAVDDCRHQKRGSIHWQSVWISFANRCLACEVCSRECRISIVNVSCTVLCQQSKIDLPRHLDIAHKDSSSKYGCLLASFPFDARNHPLYWLQSWLMHFRSQLLVAWGSCRASVHLFRLLCVLSNRQWSVPGNSPINRTSRSSTPSQEASDYSFAAIPPPTLHLLQIVFAVHFP